MNADCLRNFWHADHENFERTLGATIQRCARMDNSSLEISYSTNNMMLSHKRTDEHFFMDTFLSTKKNKKLPRGNVCCQIFGTDKGFIFNF